MSANNSTNDVTKPASQQATLPNSPPSVSTSNSGSMIDSRNTYKVSPVKVSLANQPQQQQLQDIVKIRLTKDESGKGLGYTKSIISSSSNSSPAPTLHPSQGKRSSSTSSLIVINKDKQLTTSSTKRETIKTFFIKKPPGTASAKAKKESNFVSDKTDNKTSPPSTKMSINLAQQPTLQLKTAQNKIVLVKMLPKMPPSGPQVVAAPGSSSRNNLSPTTLALARSVQGLRPIPPVNSPPSATVTSPTVTLSKATTEKKDPEVALSASSVSLTSSNLTLTTSTTSTSSNVTPCKTETSDEPMQSLDQTANSTMETDEMDSSSINTSSVKMSREMRCLKASQSNSKILSEFMQDSSSSEKLRKRHRSRCEGEDSRSCGSVTPTSQKRFSLSGRDEEDLDESKAGSPTLGGSGTKRSGMRSANAEFSQKQRKFLAGIHQHSDGSDGSDNEGGAEEGGGGAPKEEKDSVASLVPVAPKAGYDKFCWRCKTSEPGLETCAGCIRCFHPVCLKLNPAFFIVEKKWNCPECIKLQPAIDEGGKEDSKPAKDKLKIDSLIVSLKFALKRMQLLKGSNLFNPFDKHLFPHYDEYVTYHMDLEMIQKNVADRKYRTTEEFLADVSWMLHNASIYPNNNKLLPIAKAIVKVCKQELNEIEACNECYFNANTCKLWFTEVCTKPHLLVWAKLKGFPFWPAKLMSVNSNQLVDVRFFGDHDRAWVPIKECLLFCEKDPNTKMQRRTNMAECMREAEAYIGKLKRKFGQFRYAEFRTQVEANKLDQHLEAMIPGVLKRISENEDSQKAKLMLRIIKTADNFLSISPLSESPPSTSTPKPDKVNEATSPKRKCTEKSTGAPRLRARSKSADSSIKEEIRNSESTPEPGDNPAMRLTRKRKRSSSLDESKTKDSSAAGIAREMRRRSSRASAVFNKSKEDERGGAATPEPNGPRCYANVNRKRQSESPLPEPKQDKVESVLIQRKSDSWKTVPAGKKQKMSSKSSEEASEVKESVAEPAQPKATEEKPSEPEKQPEPAASQPASKETDKSAPAEVNKTTTVAPIPLAPTEIKTEVVEEEPATEPTPAVEQPAAAEKPTVEPTTTRVPESTKESAPQQQQLLPIKVEPLSDDEIEQVYASASGTSHQTLNPNQVLIRTGGNRIMVKDINKMTSQMSARAGGNQPLILTPVEKPKGLTSKIIPKMLPTAVAQQKTRRSFLTNAQQSTVTLNRTNPGGGGSMPSASSSGPARNGNNMMHMVHIPSPLPTSSQDSRSSDHATANGATQPSLRPQQASSNCDTTQPTDGPAATAGPSTSSTVVPTPTTPPDDSQHMMAGFITPSLAAAVTETIVSTPPKLQSRPSGALRSEGDCVYPSGAGPVSQILINNSYKMADFFRSVIEDTLADLSNNSGALEAKVKVLELEIEKLKHCHQQEISKLKHNSDLVLCEMRKNMDLEKTRLINEVRKQCELERIRSVEEAKKKQWCVNCGKEALFYCCWNTSYCDYPCQQQHWATHMNQCTQSQFNLPSTAIANKPQVNNKMAMSQQITTPKITTVQTLNLNGRSGLTIQPTQQHSQQQQQQQLIITSARGGAQLGKGQSFQRLMINPNGGGSSSTIVSNAPSNGNKWITTICSATQPVCCTSIVTASVPPTPVGIMTSSSVVTAAVQGGNLGRPSATREKLVMVSK